jgi:hypothetical protein
MTAEGLMARYMHNEYRRAIQGVYLRIEFASFRVDLDSNHPEGFTPSYSDY